MAIDLPPVLPPVLAQQDVFYEKQRQAAQAPAVEGDIAGTTVKVAGDRYLGTATLQSLMQAAAVPSDFIRSLTQTYYDQGHILTRVLYYRDGPVVSVFVSEYALEEIRGDEKITRYFDGLKGDSDLTMAEFYRARELASIRSRRSGIHYQPRFTIIDNDRAALVFESKPNAEHHSVEPFVELNNRGSRFAGRYYALAGLNKNFSSGTQVQAGFRHAFPELGGSREGAELDQVTFSVDHPFTFGLYGFQASYVDYQTTLQSQQFTAGSCALLVLGCTPATVSRVESDADGEIAELALTGKQFLRSSPSSRLSLSQKLEYVATELMVDGQASPVLDESYQYIDLGVEYSRKDHPVESPKTLKASLNLRYGLGDDGGTLDSYDEFRANYTPGSTPPDVVPAARSGDFLMLHPDVEFKWRFTDNVVAGFHLAGQIADEQLPQQQQYVLGGMYSLSAYLPGALVGDEGYFARVDLTTRYNWWGFDWRPSVFAEYGATQFVNADSDLGDRQSAADVGLRLTTDFGHGLTMDIVAARPISDDVLDEERLEAAEADFFWRFRKSFY